MALRSVVVALLAAVALPFAKEGAFGCSIADVNSAFDPNGNWEPVPEEPRYGEVDNTSAPDDVVDAMEDVGDFWQDT